MMADEAENGGWSINGGAQQAEEMQRPEEEPVAVPLSSPLASSAGEALSSSEEKECPVCRSPFDLEHHAPKLLECLHTFCLECLRQLHMRAIRSLHSAVREGRDCADQGASITCPLCRNRTATSDDLLHDLPVNSKLTQTFPPDRLLPPAPWQTPEPVRQRPLLEQSGDRATRPERAWASVVACCNAWNSTWLVGFLLLSMVLLSVVVGIVFSAVKCNGSFCEGAVFLPFFLLVVFICITGCCLIMCTCTKRCKGLAVTAEIIDSTGRHQVRFRPDTRRLQAAGTQTPYHFMGEKMGTSSHSWVGLKAKSSSSAPWSATQLWEEHEPHSHVESGWGGCVPGPSMSPVDSGCNPRSSFSRIDSVLGGCDLDASKSHVTFEWDGYNSGFSFSHRDSGRSGCNSRLSFPHVDTVLGRSDMGSSESHVDTVLGRCNPGSVVSPIGSGWDECNSRLSFSHRDTVLGVCDLGGSRSHVDIGWQGWDSGLGFSATDSEQGGCNLGFSFSHLDSGQGGCDSGFSFSHLDSGQGGCDSGFSFSHLDSGQGGCDSGFSFSHLDSGQGGCDSGFSFSHLDSGQGGCDSGFSFSQAERGWSGYDLGGSDPGSCHEN
ncbi:uncharacterized protein LOC128350910 [Hemicordylus capensis]|uniref:uncharacterized protein LOC128350910 n=1 Tax=Hemicordylus capensis TaxID=884348 RepID=UPI002303D9FC|nr:uncharacterized protein LOC128350910 [Hemicordylus capensis]